MENNKLKESWSKFWTRIQSLFVGLKYKNLLIICLLICSVTLVIYSFLKIRHVFFLKKVFIWFAANPIWSLLFLNLVITCVVFIYNWKFTSARTWYWRKVAFIAIVVNTLLVLVTVVDGVKINITPLERAKLDTEYQQKIDSIKTVSQERIDSTLSAYKKDDERAIKISEKKVKELETNLAEAKQNLDSLTANQDQALRTSKEKVKELKIELATLKQSFDSATVANQEKEAIFKKASESYSDGFSDKGKILIILILIALVVITWFSLNGKKYRSIATISLLAVTCLIVALVQFFPEFFISPKEKKEVIAKVESAEKKQETAIDPTTTPEPVKKVDTVAKASPDSVVSKKPKSETVTTKPKKSKKKTAVRKSRRRANVPAPPYEERLKKVLDARNAKRKC